MVQKELNHVCTKYGITPDKAVDTQLGDAIEAAINASAFMNYAHFQDTVAGALASGVPVTRSLAQVTNNITGVSIAANQITLPAGTYRVVGCGSANSTFRHQATLYNINDSVVALHGISAYADEGDPTVTTSRFTGQFTIAGTKVFEMQHQAQSSGFLGLSAAFGSDVYGDLEIWKIA